MSDVPDIQLDNPDEIRWFEGRGPAPVLGPCPHNCERHRHSLIAWGPTTDRYKLVECSGYPPSECDGRCRAWLDGWGNEVTAWLMHHPSYVLRIVRSEHPCDQAPERMANRDQRLIKA